MGEAKERRKVVEQRVKDGLAALSFQRLRGKDRFLSDSWTEEPLQTLLLVTVDTDKYGTVRISGSVTVIAPPVEELFSTAAPSTLSPGQELYFGRLPFDLAGSSLKKLVDPDRMTPLEWRVTGDDDIEPAVEGFLRAVDGPVRDWVGRHATVDAVRAAADQERGRPDEGSTVRTVAALEALGGDVPGALARLDRYREAPSKGDTAERVQAFADWLTSAVAASSR